MKLYFTILFIATLATVNSTAHAQDSLLNRIFILSYNQEYVQANSLLQANKNSIDAIYYAVLDIDMSYWKNVTGTNNPDYTAFETTQQKYNTENAETFEQKVIQLITLSYQLRYELKRYKFFNAISTHKKTKTIFNELKTNTHTQEFEQQELLQLYNSMFSYFDNYLNPFGGKTKKSISEEALLNMEKLANSEQEMVKTLASYFVAKTYLKYEKIPEKGIPYFQHLCKQYPGNLKFRDLLEECKNKIDN